MDKNVPASMPDATGTDLIESTHELFSVIFETKDIVRELEKRVHGYERPVGGEIAPPSREGLLNESVDNIRLAVRELHNLRCDLKGLLDILQ